MFVCEGGAPVCVVARTARHVRIVCRLCPSACVCVFDLERAFCTHVIAICADGAPLGAALPMPPPQVVPLTL